MILSAKCKGCMYYEEEDDITYCSHNRLCIMHDQYEEEDYWEIFL